MRTIVAHRDSDGIISAALLIRHIGGEGWKLKFGSAATVKDTILRSALGRGDLSELFVVDISPNRYAIRAASVYDRATWIDHHEVGEIEKRENVELVLDPSAPSCAGVVARHLGVEDALVEIADQIDTNSVRDPVADLLRDTIGYFRWKLHGHELDRKLEEVTLIAAEEGVEALLERYDEDVQEYREWLKEVVAACLGRARSFHVKGLKVVIIEAEGGVPVYAIFNALRRGGEAPDILVVQYTRPTKNGAITKLEFRTAGDVDVRKLASLFGGGGHKKASGATVDGIVTLGELLRAIELLY